MSPVQRAADIITNLETVGDSLLINDPLTPQGRATTWLIEQDTRGLCPPDDQLIQRWTLAVIYYSTGGDTWNQCSENGLDACGLENPFIGKQRFLSEFNECQWAGISCNVDSNVTEIEFEENNLVGTIPTEIGLLTDLIIWGMERGTLTGQLPSEIGLLSQLIFLDLDFNDLSGSLPTEIYLLTGLTQFDINNNRFSGKIDQMGVFDQLQFLQIHANLFTGEVPASMGALNQLTTFTLHETSFTGEMPGSVCDLLVTNGGLLSSLIADCAIPFNSLAPEIICNCCTDCRSD